MAKLLERAHQRALGVPGSISTPYINTIPAEEEPDYPGDEWLEKRIRRFIRWNAAVMVIKANNEAKGIGGHLSTFASSALLYEVGFHHFFRGKADGTPGDAVYIQGHAAPGIYARAFLEGRLEEAQLDGFRTEIGGGRPVVVSPPAADAGVLGIPHRVDGSRSDQLHLSGPVQQVPAQPGLDDTERLRVWCFVGDGEVDEPETLGSISLAAREGLDNLTWVINCNLQRLDGPVRGNGKIIQELEAIFRGAGWNVIKVIWGGNWDPLLDADHDGALVEVMNSTVDGEYQRYKAENGAYVREHFFGKDPRTLELVQHLSDDEIWDLRRGGHDVRKVYAAYQAATSLTGAPTVILAKTIKGWTLGPDVEGRNATHQIKELTNKQLLELRARLHLEDEIPEESLAGDNDPPYFRPSAGSPEHDYLMERRTALNGPLPSRTLPVRVPLDLPKPEVFAETYQGSGKVEASTTTAFTRLLRNMARAERLRPEGGADRPGRGAHLRDGLAVPRAQDLRLPGPAVRIGRRRHAPRLHREQGRPDPGGGDHRSGIDRIVAGGRHVVRHPGRAARPVLHLLLDVRMATGRRPVVGGCGRPGARVPHRRHRRPDHPPGRGTAAPGRPLVDPLLGGACVPRLRPGVRLRDGRHHRGRHPAHVRRLRGRLLLPHRLQRELRTASQAARTSTRGSSRGSTVGRGSRRVGTDAAVLFSGPPHLAAREAQRTLAEEFGIGVELWSVTSYKNLREEAMAAERWNLLNPTKQPRVPRSRRSCRTIDGPKIAVTDFMRIVPDQVGRWVPGDYVILGTDGFGRSDTRQGSPAVLRDRCPTCDLRRALGAGPPGTRRDDTVRKAADRFGIDGSPVLPGPADILR
jgi:pyruvate dehydrogenase E1 component